MFVLWANLFHPFPVGHRPAIYQHSDGFHHDWGFSEKIPRWNSVVQLDFWSNQSGLNPSTGIFLKAVRSLPSLEVDSNIMKHSYFRETIVVSFPTTDHHNEPRSKFVPTNIFPYLIFWLRSATKRSPRVVIYLHLPKPAKRNKITTKEHN